MNDTIGRAGFHVVHTKSISERGAILHEMMRELDEGSIAYWAKRNPNIVVEDETLNEAMVNDGAGGFRPCTDRSEVLAYGDSRTVRLSRKLRADSDGERSGSKGGTVTTTMIVAHLPKSMCREIPDAYAVVDQHGRPVLSKTTREPKMRSRWVARDRDQARRYFEDVVNYLGEHVVPGGMDGILAYDIQHSETTPHVQILADAFGEDPNKPGRLRPDASRAWYSHRDVRDSDGKQKSGSAKLRDYHAGLKRHLVDLGYDVSADFDEERHMVGLGKQHYGEVMDAKHAMADGLWDWQRDLREQGRELQGLRRDLDQQARAQDAAETDLQHRRDELETRERELPRRRRQAVLDGHAEGLQAGREEAQAQAERQSARLRSEAAQWLAQHHQRLWDEFLDRQDRQGRSYRPVFDRFVDTKLKQTIQQLEHKLGLSPGDIGLEPDDREQFIRDGGTALAAEIAQQQRQREAGPNFGG